MASIENVESSPELVDWEKNVMSDIVSALHDVGQNIRMISWQAMLLQKDTSLSEAAKSSVSHISTHLSQVISLLGEVINLSRTNIRRDLEMTRVALPQDLTVIMDAFRTQAASAGLAFDFEVQENVPAFIYTDVSYLRRIISNLLNNALKFTNRGFISVLLGFDSNQLEILVSDTGQGIALEHQSEIFWPYNHLNESQEGLGFGLFGAKILANRIGGDLNLVSSSPGRGSVFRAVVPNRNDFRAGGGR